MYIWTVKHVKYDICGSGNQIETRRTYNQQMYKNPEREGEEISNCKHPMNLFPVLQTLPVLAQHIECILHSPITQILPPSLRMNAKNDMYSHPSTRF